jgi:hypothetical protein
MRTALLATIFGLLLTVWSAPVFAQQGTTEAEIKRQVPYSAMRRSMPGLTLQDYNRAVRDLARVQTGVTSRGPGRSNRRPTPERVPDHLGRLSTNPYLPDSTANPYGRSGNRYAPNGLNNPYGRYGNKFSPNSPNNPYALDTPRLYGDDGKYLGKLSSNPYDPESIANPYGRYGNPYSPDSVKNPYGVYGSPYSPLSPTNPYAVTPPFILGPNPR